MCLQSGTELTYTCGMQVRLSTVVEYSWNVLAHGDALEGKWRGNWRMEWVNNNLHTTSECGVSGIRLLLKCDGTRAETRFRLSTKQTSPFKSAEASVQSTAGRGTVHISLQGLYCSCKPTFCSHVTLTGYPLHSLVSPSLSLPCVTVCHHIPTGLYYHYYRWRAHLGCQ